MTDKSLDCGSVAIDELRKRAEQYYSKSYEIDHSDEYERDRLGHLAEGIEEAIDYIVAARNMDSGSMHPKVEASIADLRAIAVAHPELSDELHDVIGQLRDTECRPVFSSADLRLLREWFEAMRDAYGTGSKDDDLYRRLGIAVRAMEQESKPPSDES